MTFKEYIKEKAIPWEMVHLLSSSKCYDGTDDKILYVSLPENYDSPVFLVLSKRLSALVNKRAILLTEAEVQITSDVAGLICPVQNKKSDVIDDATRSRLATFLQESFLEAEHSPGEYLAINKIDYSPTFGDYEYQTVYHTHYDEDVGNTRYPVDEIIRPKVFETHYLFDADEIHDDNAVDDFVLSIERVISARKRAPKLYLLIKQIIGQLLHHYYTGTYSLELNLVMGFVRIIPSDSVNENDEGRSIGEYYIDVDDLIYDELEDEALEYGDGISSFLPSPCYIQQFIISSLEDYYNCRLYVPQFWGDPDPVFMEWYEQ